MTTPNPLLGLIIKHSDAMQGAKAHKELHEDAQERGKESRDPVYKEQGKNR